jgi:hypothetical protein
MAGAESELRFRTLIADTWPESSHLLRRCGVSHIPGRREWLTLSDAGWLDVER